MRAQMKLPGRAWIEFEVRPTDRGSVIRQTAVFDPSGLLDLLYWYGVYPLHAAVFRGMLAGIARAAQQALWPGQQSEPKNRESLPHSVAFSAFTGGTGCPDLARPPSRI
jgi:hypothetical protein